MDIFAIGVCAICAVAFGTLLKKSNREYALVLTVCAAVLLLVEILGQAQPLVEEIERLGSDTSQEYMEIMLKAVGITLAGQFAAHVCKDAGESSLAYTVELATKVAILVVALPVFLQILEYLRELLTL